MGSVCSKPPVNDDNPSADPPTSDPPAPVPALPTPPPPADESIRPAAEKPASTAAAPSPPPPTPADLPSSRASAAGAEQPAPPPAADKPGAAPPPPPPATLGVSLRFLQQVWEEMWEEMSQASADVPPDPLASTAAVCTRWLIPRTAARRVSYARLAWEDNLLDDKGHPIARQATAFVSHAWGESFHNLVSALGVGDTSASHYFYVDVFCINQHAMAEVRSDKDQHAAVLEELTSCLRGCGRVVAAFTPWRTPALLARAWCLYELALAYEEGLPVDAVLPAKQHHDFFSALAADPDQVMGVLGRIDVKRATATYESDRQLIFARVEAHEGFNAVNRNVTAALRGWVIRTCCNYAAEMEAEADKALGGAALSEGLSVQQVMGMCNQAARLLQWHGHFEDAQRLYEKALRLCRSREAQGDGAAAAERVEVMVNLAGVLSQRGLRAEAIELLQTARAEQEAEGIPNVRLYAITLSNLSEPLIQSGDLPAAAAVLERCLAVLDGAAAAAAPAQPTAAEDAARLASTTATTLYNLAIIRMQQGDDAAAVRLHERALAIREPLLGASHPHVAVSLSGLAVALSKVGRASEAVGYAERAIEIREMTLGPAHPETLQAYNGLGMVYVAMPDDKEAAKAIAPLQKALEGLRMVEHSVGPVGTARVCMRKAELLTRLGGDDAKAEMMALWKEAADKLEAALGPRDSQVAMCLSKYAETLHALGRLKEAEDIYRKVLLIVDTSQNPMERGMGGAKVRMGLAEVLWSVGGERTQEAIAVAEEALQLRLGIVGEGHPIIEATRAVVEGYRASAAAMAA
ncbi:hypothetical protein AB1Y20_017332 [Prymnesium parvum]|uniref:Kinesin light chain n=1 Tax=Prymnesium parvum TaxID=97485 RepID=A0AB34JMW2_PRYPA